MTAIDREGVWNISEEGLLFKDTIGLNVTTAEVVGSQKNLPREAQQQASGSATVYYSTMLMAEELNKQLMKEELIIHEYLQVNTESIKE